MQQLNNLISSSNPNKPKCYPCKTCISITIVIEVSNPCRGELAYGHAGMALGDSYKDTGMREWTGALKPYWSLYYPSLTQLEDNVDALASAPVIKAELCVCQKDAAKIAKTWKSIYNSMEGSFGARWGTGLTCSTSVIISLFPIYFNPLYINSLVTPDGLLNLIVPKLKNSCGSEMGKSAHFEFMKKANTFK